MHTTYLYKTEIENYWNLLKDAKSEVKLRLITLLSQSVINEVEESSERRTSKNPTTAFLAKHAGVWKGNETAETIIANISEGHNCKNPVSFE